MKIEIKESEWTGKEVQVMANFTVSLEELQRSSYGRDFDGIYKAVSNLVSDHIANKIISEKSAEIVSAIDIDEIIKRIKLNIVQNVARN